MNNILADLNNIPDDIMDSLIVLSGWNFVPVIIQGRIIMVDGEYNFANEYDSTSSHEIRGKDMTKFIIDHKNFFVKGNAEEEFRNAYDGRIQTRLFRYHGDTRYLQIVKS